MKSKNQIENPDVILIGSGIMSSNLGALLKNLSPEMTIQLYEVSKEFAQEASNGWNNAGTGHAGICELSYTPNRGADGEVDVAKAISIFAEFEQSLSFWGYAVRTGMIKNPKEFINPVPHMSFVHGAEQVDYLESRFRGMSKHHFFDEMEFSTDRDLIKSWAPLLLDGRSDEPIAATRLTKGTDVNFGRVANKLIEWLGEQEGCGYASGHRVTDLTRKGDRWEVEVKDLATGKTFINTAKFVFIGAGGGSIQLLQKSKIPEIKGYGGFPIGGQWLVCDKPEIVAQHQAKIYGQNLDTAPTMAIPHLDTRIIDGKKSLLFGPFASWTTKFLYHNGSMLDLPASVRPDNIASLIKVGLGNIDLVKYLVQQGTQSMKDRIELLRIFHPNAKEEDWKLIDGGIRVQAIKKEDGDAGIVHFGTEVVTNADRSISSLLGASPGASVSVNITLEVIKKCFSHLLKTEDGHARMKAMIPSYDLDLVKEDKNTFLNIRKPAEEALQLV